MRFLTLAQASPSPSPFSAFQDIEVTFFKLVALVVMLLWVVYLLKEIFFPHKEDKRIARLEEAIEKIVASLSQTTTQLAVLASEQKHLHDSDKEQWIVINGLRRSISTLAEEQAGLESLTAANAKPPKSPLRR